jgi:hypothetical protein
VRPLRRPKELTLRGCNFSARSMSTWTNAVCRLHSTSLNGEGERKRRQD